MKISIEGNLACGKSTLLARLQELTHIPTFPEPVASWNFLTDFYKDPERWGFTFNLEVLTSMTRWSKIEYMSIFERSPMSCRKVFTQLQAEDGIMTPNELIIFDKIYKELAWDQDVIIYIETDPLICYKRMHERNRACEEEVDKDYIVSIHLKHVEMMEYVLQEKQNIQLFVVDGNASADEVYANVFEIISRL
jgi:deoxyadenosine/deoxycytidine kinase